MKNFFACSTPVTSSIAISSAGPLPQPSTSYRPPPWLTRSVSLPPDTRSVSRNYSLSLINIHICVFVYGVPYYSSCTLYSKMAPFFFREFIVGNFGFWEFVSYTHMKKDNQCSLSRLNFTLLRSSKCLFGVLEYLSATFCPCSHGRCPVRIPEKPIFFTFSTQYPYPTLDT